MRNITILGSRKAIPLLVVTLWLTASSVVTQDADSAGKVEDESSTQVDSEGSEGRAARGRRAYRIYCESCHGEGGKGDGPVAEWLKIPPTDLTRLSARNGDRFPAEQVYRSIDGRTEVRGHGPSDMPVWGLTFQDPGRSDNQEVELHERILDLVEYLRSKQRLDAGSESG